MSGSTTCTHLTDYRDSEILNEPGEVFRDCGHGQRGTGAKGRNDERLGMEAWRGKLQRGFLVTCALVISSQGASRFFSNREMEDDLVLNLATDDPGPGSSRTAHAKKGGKWTDR